MVYPAHDTPFARHVLTGMLHPMGSILEKWFAYELIATVETDSPDAITISK